MIKVGEATGALEEMLTNVSDFYDEAIEAQLQAHREPHRADHPRRHGRRHRDDPPVDLPPHVHDPLQHQGLTSRRSGAHEPDQVDSADAAIPRFLDAASEETRARQLAERLGLPYVDLWTFRIDAELFRVDPARLDAPLRVRPREGARTASSSVVMADPSDVVKLDELEVLLRKRLKVKVGSRAAIQEILQKSESTQRVLEEATEDFRMQVVREDEEGEEVLSIDRITADASPIIKLVDSTLFNAIQRRASDIHIETREHEVVIKYRIDGVLYPAMEPIDKQHHQTIISRIKVMSELDIAEKRIPQDGRFKLRVKGRTIDFRVSIMPSVHGEDAVIRILDKESANAEFKNLRLDVLGFDPETMRHAAQVHPRALRHGARDRARPARARRRRSTRASRRSSPSRTRSSRSRTRSSTSCAASRRSR